MPNFTKLLQILLWCAALLGALQLGRVNLPAGYQHAICGPWGCGPRVMDLAAYHLFQVLFLIGPVFLVVHYAKPPWPSRLSGLLLSAGLCLLLGVLVQEIVTNWATHHQHFVQRYLFRIATAVDIPAIALLSAGVGAVWFSRRTKAAQEITVQERGDTASASKVSSSVGDLL